MTTRYDTEKDVERETLRWLSKYQGSWDVIHTKGLPNPNSPSGYQKNPNRSMTDLIGFVMCKCDMAHSRFVESDLAPFPVSVYIELKKPKAKPRKDQEEFMQAKRDAGGIAFWGDNAGAIERELLLYLDELSLEPVLVQK